MDEFLHDAQKVTTLFGILAMCGAAVGIGFAGLCKLLKWAPVNTTINIYNKVQDKAE